MSSTVEAENVGGDFVVGKMKISYVSCAEDSRNVEWIQIPKAFRLIKRVEFVCGDELIINKFDS